VWRSGAIIYHVTGRVFICHSADDVAYVRRLVEHLTEAGIPVTSDRDGARSWRRSFVVRQRLDSCAAVIAVMSPSAEASKQVARELHRADQQHRPVFPMLLAGGGPLFQLGDLEYVDVRQGRMPDDEFIERLRRVLAAADLAEPAPPATLRRRLAIAAGVAVLALLAGLVAIVGLAPGQARARATDPPTDPATTVKAGPPTVTNSPTTSHAATTPLATSALQVATTTPMPTTTPAPTTSASYAPTSTSASLASPTLMSLSCPSVLLLFQQVHGTVTLSSAYAARIVVTLNADKPAYAIMIPSYATVPAGATSAKFAIEAITPEAIAHITANLDGVAATCQFEAQTGVPTL
jgi:hypothetical protein